MWKVMLVEDQSIVRQGIKMMLEQQQHIQVVAEASNGQEAIEQLGRTVVDLILLDIRMPVMTGLEATAIIRKRWSHIKIIVLTTFNDDEYTVEALKQGVHGFLLKTADSDKLISAIESCMNGGMPIQDEVTASVIPKLMERPIKPRNADFPLSEREMEIVKCVGMGMTNKEIANELYLSIGTIKNHITTILQKLELRDRTQLAIYAVKNHLS